MPNESGLEYGGHYDTEAESAPRSSHCYPSLDQYHGGGSILNEHTTIRDVTQECRRSGISADEVFSLIRNGNEVIICDGKIQAVGKY